MSDAAPKAPAKLSAVGQLTPFGRNNEGVLDDTYWITDKMDKTHFACKLNVEVPKTLDIIRLVLFNEGDEKQNTGTELYELTVPGVL
jgi:hypothetical protein